MKSNLARIQHRLRLHECDRGTLVTARWTVFTGSPALNPVTGGRKGVAASETLQFRAHYHEVTSISGTVRQFAEISSGDAIIDFDPAVEFGTEDLTFVITGKEWVPKEVGAQLAASWDSVVAGVTLGRTLLLRLKT